MKPYNALMKAEKLKFYDAELNETMEEEEKAAISWERRVAFVLCNHEKGMIFKALEDCLKSNSIEIAKSCLVIATWIVYMLYSLPDTGVRTHTIIWTSASGFLLPAIVKEGITVLGICASMIHHITCLVQKEPSFSQWTAFCHPVKQCGSTIELILIWMVGAKIMRD